MPAHSIDKKLLTLFLEQRSALLLFLRRRLDNAATAEDLVQDIWVRAAAGDAGATLRNPRAYLFRIAANLATDHRRRERHRESLEAPEILSRVADGQPDPETILRHRQRLAGLLNAVDELPPRCREVFVNVKVHGLSYAETAARMGIAKNTVMVHMTNALAHLAAHHDADAED